MAKAINLQDMFLNQVRKEGISVTVYLIGGVQLRGQVRGFDAFTILLDSPGKPTQLVYKHAVTSIVPARPVGGYRPQEGGFGDREGGYREREGGGGYGDREGGYRERTSFGDRGGAPEREGGASFREPRGMPENQEEQQ